MTRLLPLVVLTPGCAFIGSAGHDSRVAALQTDTDTDTDTDDLPPGTAPVITEVRFGFAYDDSTLLSGFSALFTVEDVDNDLTEGTLEYGTAGTAVPFSDAQPLQSGWYRFVIPGSLPADPCQASTGADFEFVVRDASGRASQPAVVDLDWAFQTHDETNNTIADQGEPEVTLMFSQLPAIVCGVRGEAPPLLDEFDDVVLALGTNRNVRSTVNYAPGSADKRHAVFDDVFELPLAESDNDPQFGEQILFSSLPTGTALTLSVDLGSPTTVAGWAMFIEAAPPPELP